MRAQDRELLIVVKTVGLRSRVVFGHQTLIGLRRATTGAVLVPSAERFTCKIVASTLPYITMWSTRCGDEVWRREVSQKVMQDNGADCCRTTCPGSAEIEVRLG